MAAFDLPTGETILLILKKLKGLGGLVPIENVHPFRTINVNQGNPYNNFKR